MANGGKRGEHRELRARRARREGRSGRWAVGRRLGAAVVLSLSLGLGLGGAGVARASAGTGADLDLGLQPNGPRIGAAVLLGGGVQSFTTSGARAVADFGAFWSARFMWGSRHPIGVEAAYIGSAQSLDALGLEPTALLVSNGAEAVLRLNVPVVRGAFLFEPFVIGGLGWSVYQIERTTTASADLASEDSVLKVPVGGGFAFGFHAFMADLRFTYRPSYFDDLFRASGAALNTWSMGALVGVQF